MFILKKSILLLKSAIFSSNNEIYLPYNNLFIKIIKILYINGFILSFFKYKNYVNIKLSLDIVNYINNITYLLYTHKRLYITCAQLKRFFKLRTRFAILSTNNGLQTLQDCRKLNLGGLLLILV